MSKCSCTHTSGGRRREFTGSLYVLNLTSYMMDLNLVVKNEASNKGLQIFLYLSDISGQWIAYGLSAYALRLYVKAQGYDSLRAYTAELNLPCTVVSYKTVKSLRHELKIIDEQGDDMVAFEVTEGFEYEKYLMWMEKLQRENEIGEHIISIETLVSDKVPKGVFIPDGMSDFARNLKRAFDFLASGVALLVFSHCGWYVTLPSNWMMEDRLFMHRSVLVVLVEHSESISSVPCGWIRKRTGRSSRYSKGRGITD